MAERSTYAVFFEVEKAFASEFLREMKMLGDWAKMTPTAFMLTTDQPLEVIMERLQPLLGPMDSLWFFSPTTPWAGYGDPVVDDHLSAAIGPEVGGWVPKDWDDEKKARR